MEDMKANNHNGCGAHQHGEHCGSHSGEHACHQGQGGGMGLCHAPVADNREALLAQKARLEAKLAEVEKRLQSL